MLLHLLLLLYLLHLHLLLYLLLSLLLFDLLFYHSFFLLLYCKSLLIEVVFAIVVVTWVILLHLFGVEVVVPDLFESVFTWLPRARKWRLQALLRDVEQMVIALQIHAKVLGVLLDFLHCRLIILIEFFLEELIAFSNKCVT